MNYMIGYWTGTQSAGTQAISRHPAMNILFCAGTPSSPSNGFELTYVTAPRELSVKLLYTFSIIRILDGSELILSSFEKITVLALVPVSEYQTVNCSNLPQISLVAVKMSTNLLRISLIRVLLWSLQHGLIQHGMQFDND